MATRARFLALAGITIVLGLWVHLGGGLLSPPVRDVLGDALWAMMMTWGAAVAAPRAPRGVRAGIVAAILLEGAARSLERP